MKEQVTSQPYQIPTMLHFFAQYKLHSNTCITDNLQPSGWSKHGDSGSAGKPSDDHLYSARGRLSYLVL